MRLGVRKFTLEEMALAYELSCEGCHWDFIEEGIGDGIKNAVCYAKRKGLKLK